MKTSTLEALAPLLDALRAYTVLEEIRPGAFCLKGRDFIHFHETADGVVADVLLAKGRVRMPVSTDAQQAELLDRIDRQLAALRPLGDRGRRATRSRRG